VTSTVPLTESASGLLRRLHGARGLSGWVTPSESRDDAWVLLVPGPGGPLIAVRRFMETAITELVRHGHAAWTAHDEDVPPYECAMMTAERWYPRRKGRRISAVVR
jgi:hypothetical protein